MKKFFLKLLGFEGPSAEDSFRQQQDNERKLAEERRVANKENIGPRSENTSENQWQDVSLDDNAEKSE